MFEFLIINANYDYCYCGIEREWAKVRLMHKYLKYNIAVVLSSRKTNKCETNAFEWSIRKSN